MEENSWQVELLKAGINITHIDADNGLVYFDFAYRPKVGGPRVWGKSVMEYNVTDWGVFTHDIKEMVLGLRKDLEG